MQLLHLQKKGHQIAEILDSSFNIDLYSKKKQTDFNFKEVSKKVMESYKAIIFISSTGIAVKGYSTVHKKQGSGSCSASYR